MTDKNNDNLLKEIDTGLQMALYSFDHLLEHVQNPAMKKIITESRNEHLDIKNETEELIKQYNVTRETPGAIAKAMAWMETSYKTSIEESDRVVADILTKGCNMGIKNLFKYLHEFAGADATVSDIAKRLIELEEKLVKSLQLYL